MPTVLASLLAALVSGSLPADARADVACVECHERQLEARLRSPVEQLRASVHAETGMSCPDCHGGRSDVTTARAHDRTAGFRPRPSATDIPRMCGTCHANAERIHARRPDLPTDQLELYRSSVHGRALAAGRTNVATCVACHGAHDVRHVRDPRSPVAVGNVDETCARCHGDPEHMAGTGLPTDQERQWRRSAHGHAWARGRRAPTCSICHDAHRVRHGTDAVAACPRCHAKEWEAFRLGPHAAAFMRMGFLPCVDCHGSHEVRLTDPGFVGGTRDAVCPRCHADGQPMYESALRMGALTLAADRAEQAALAALRRSSASDAAAWRARIGTAHRRLAVSLHTVDETSVDANARALIEVSRQAAGVPAAFRFTGLIPAPPLALWALVATGIGGASALVAIVLMLWIALGRARDTE